MKLAAPAMEAKKAELITLLETGTFHVALTMSMDNHNLIRELRYTDTVKPIQRQTLVRKPS